MNCPECGQEGRSKFCTSCGAPLIRLVSQTHETAHFRVHCPAGSFASKKLQSIGDRLERCYEVASTLLDVSLRSGLIDVYLSELVVHHQAMGLGSGGYAVPSRMQIHDVYRSDAPGESLERSLITLLLALVLENHRPALPAVADGVLGLVVELQEGPTGGEAPSETLADLADEGRLPAIDSLLADTDSGASPGERHIRLIASIHLMRFLLKRHGVERWKEFVRLLQTTDPRQAARVALHRQLDQLDREWTADVRRRARMDMASFLPMVRAVAPPSVLTLVALLLSGLLSGGAAIIGAMALGAAFDHGGIVHNRPKLYPDLAVVAGAVIFLLLLSAGQVLVASRGTERVRDALYLWVFERGHAPVRSHQSGVVDDIEAVRSAFQTALAPGLPAAMVLVTALLAMLVISWKLALIALILLPFLFIAWLVLRQRRAGAAASERMTRDAEIQTLFDAGWTRQHFRLLGSERAARERYARAIRVLSARLSQSLRSCDVNHVILSAISGLMLLAVTGAGLWSVAGRDLRVDSLVACLLLAGVALSQARVLLAVAETLERGSQGLDRLRRSVPCESLIQEKSNPRPLLPVTRAVRLEGVSLDARSGPPLHNLNMTLPAGATVAIIGDVGCGASRLVDLCFRLRDPDQGRMTWDGVDLREVALDDLRQQVAVATADEVLLDGTIGENLRLANPDATASDVEFAARLAGLHQMVMELPKGYDTAVEDTGVHLPLLLCRRLSLARALLRKPSVLVMDRIADGLDPAAETQLYGAVQRVGHGRLTLIITDRVAGGAHADRICVMDRGRVVEQGMHDDLMRRDTLYAQLWREQEGDATAAGATRERAVCVQRVPTFAGLPPHLQMLIGDQMELQRFTPGERIAHQGARTDRLVVIRSGMIDVIARDPVLRGQTLECLYQGEYAGEMALLHDGLCGSELRAVTQVELYSLRRSDFFRLLRRAPELEERLRRVMAERTQISTRKEIGRLSTSETVHLPKRAVG